MPLQSEIINRTQDSFGAGALRPELYGRLRREEAAQGVAALKNWDIKKQRILKKRNGIVGGAQFASGPGGTVSILEGSGISGHNLNNFVIDFEEGDILFHSIGDGRVIVVVAFKYHKSKPAPTNAEIYNRIGFKIVTEDQIKDASLSFRDVFLSEPDISRGSDQRYIGNNLYLGRNTGNIRLVKVLALGDGKYQLYATLNGRSIHTIFFNEEKLLPTQISEMPFLYRFHRDEEIVFDPDPPSTSVFPVYDDATYGAHNENTLIYDEHALDRMTVLPSTVFTGYRKLIGDYSWLETNPLGFTYILADIPIFGATKDDNTVPRIGTVGDYSTALFCVMKIRGTWNISMFHATEFDVALTLTYEPFAILPPGLSDKFNAASSFDYVNTFKAIKKLVVYARPEYNARDGHPSDGVIYGRRKVESRKNDLFTSWGVEPSILNNFIPSGFQVTNDILEKIDGGVTEDFTQAELDALKVQVIPDPRNATSDEVYYYQLQLQELATPGSAIPFKYTVGSDSDQIQWVANHRGLVVGLKDRILRTLRPPLASQFQLEEVQTYDGAGNRLTARGEYNLFYVGSGGEAVYGLIYDGNTKDGLRAVDFSMYGGRPGKVNGMFWNAEKNCLYVSRDGVKGLDVLYLDSEYQVRGWGVYETLLVDYFRGGVFLNGPIFLGLGGNAYFENTFNRDGVDRDIDIQSDVDFFKNVPAGQEGATGYEYFSVGKTNIVARNCTRIKKLDDLLADEVIDANKVNHKFRAGQGLIEFRDLQIGGIQDQYSILPLLRLRHDVDEPAEILSTSSRIEISRE